MNYNVFKKTLMSIKLDENIEDLMTCGDHTIAINDLGDIFLNGKKTQFESVEECVEYVEDAALMDEIHSSIIHESFCDIPENVVVNLIESVHDIKVTDTLIETYIGIAADKVFIADEVIYELRMMNTVSNLIEDRVDFKLDDDSIVVITQETYKVINTILREEVEIVQFMRKNKDNFLDILRQIEA